MRLGTVGLMKTQIVGICKDAATRFQFVQDTNTDSYMLLMGDNLRLQYTRSTYWIVMEV